MLPTHSFRMSIFNNYHTILLLFFMSISFLLTTVSSMNTGRTKDKGKVEEIKHGEFVEFLFIGSVEPKIEPKHTGMGAEYQITVSSKTVGSQQHFKHSEMTSSNSRNDHRHHHFSIPLRFHRNDLKKKEEKIGFLEMATLKWVKWLFPAKDEEPPCSNGIEQIEVEVRAQFDNGKEVIRTWLFVDPDFSLHYKLNVGVLAGSEFWLKAKISLPSGIQLEPEDKITLAYVRREPLMEIIVEQMEALDQHIEETYSFGEMIEKKKGTFMSLNKGNILRIAFKLDVTYVHDYLTNSSDKPIIKLVFEHYEFVDSIKKETEKQEGKMKELKTEGSSQDEKSRTQVSSDCAICLSEMDERQWCNNCGHPFHMKCILEWLRRQSSCPLCRRNIPDIKIHTFMLLFEDPVLSTNDEHNLFEYKCSMTNGDEVGSIGNASHKFLEEMGTEEQMEFLKMQDKWMPARQELSILLETGPHANLPFWKEHAVRLAQSRLMTVKVTRLPTNGEEKGKRKEVV